MKNKIIILASIFLLLLFSMKSENGNDRHNTKNNVTDNGFKKEDFLKDQNYLVVKSKKYD